MDREGNDRKRLLHARLLAITILLSQLEESDTGTENGSDNGSVVSQQSTAAASLKSVTIEAEPPATCSMAQKGTDAAEQEDNENATLATLDSPLRRRQQTGCRYATVPVNNAIPGIDIGQNSRFSPGLMKLITDETDETDNRSVVPAVESPTDPWIPSLSISSNKKQQPPPIKSSYYSNASFLLESPSPSLRPTSSSSSNKNNKKIASSSSFSSSSPSTKSIIPTTKGVKLLSSSSAASVSTAAGAANSHFCSHHSPRIDAAVRREAAEGAPRQKTTIAMQFTTGFRMREGSQYFSGSGGGGGDNNNYVDGIVRPTTGTGSIISPQIENRTHCIHINNNSQSSSRVDASFVPQTPPPEYHLVTSTAPQFRNDKKFRGEDRVISSSDTNGHKHQGSAVAGVSNGSFFGDFGPFHQSSYYLQQGGDSSSSSGMSPRPLAVGLNHHHRTAGNDEAPIWKLQELERLHKRNCSDGDSGHLTGSDEGGSGPDLNLAVAKSATATPTPSYQISSQPADHPCSSAACQSSIHKSLPFSKKGQPKASAETTAADKNQEAAAKSLKISPLSLNPTIGQQSKSVTVAGGPMPQSSNETAILVDSFNETDCLLAELTEEEEEEAAAGVTNSINSNSNSNSSEFKVTTV